MCVCVCIEREKKTLYKYIIAIFPPWWRCERGYIRYYRRVQSVGVKWDDVGVVLSVQANMRKHNRGFSLSLSSFLSLLLRLLFLHLLLLLLILFVLFFPRLMQRVNFGLCNAETPAAILDLIFNEVAAPSLDSSWQFSIYGRFSWCNAIQLGPQRFKIVN